MEPLAPDTQSLEALRSEDSRRVVEAMRQWRRRSRLIAFFRRALPAAIILLLLLLIGWVVARTILAGMADLAAQRAEVRMTNPRFYGQDGRGQGFVLGAAEAVQDRRRPEIIRLTRPDLRLNATGERPTTVTAATGVYVETTRQVTLTDDVVVIDGGSGYRFESAYAEIDTVRGVISGDRGISGTGPTGSVQAPNYAIYDNGARVVFRGSGETKVTGVINPRRRDNGNER